MRFTEHDAYLFAEGTHRRLYDRLGAHPAMEHGRRGFHFAVWAPNAEAVWVCGEFSGWDPHAHPLTLTTGGVWQGFVPDVQPGQQYKYRIASKYWGYIVDKADPFAFAAEVPPATASLTWAGHYRWHDADYLRQRPERQRSDRPMAIYEVHLGSWMRVPEEGNRSLSYREAAIRLVEYVRRCGFTHVELMPIFEHPFFGSWGYQITGYFAPTHRYGEPEDLMFLVDALHQAGIGVILDWVPGHFPNDEHGLGYFDGTHLFEHADPRQGYHPEWNSLIFNFGRNEVRSFLISSALFWLERFHMDGLRIDGVASMLYLDYARRPGEWVPNSFGGRENLDAVALLRDLNRAVRATHTGAITIAEDSTSWPLVTRVPEIGGLGFHYKWDMGWMNDTLAYLRHDPIHRRYHHQNITFRSVYQYQERYVLPLSHDEVVHGKGSLLTKMAGDDWQKFATVRLLFGLQYTLPGKKMLFMGNEFAQRAEWNHDGSLDWHLLSAATHRGVQSWVIDLNRVYRAEAALHEGDVDAFGFEWIDGSDVDNQVILFLRRAVDGRMVAVAANFTPIVRHDYWVGVPVGGDWDEVLNSDSTLYGGSGVGLGGGVHAEERECHGRPFTLRLTLPPLAVVVLRPRALPDNPVRN
jgi:1,4-alpha-glucan branching enzyme